MNCRHRLVGKSLKETVRRPDAIRFSLAKLEDHESIQKRLASSTITFKVNFLIWIQFGDTKTSLVKRRHLTTIQWGFLTEANEFKISNFTEIHQIKFYNLETSNISKGLEFQFEFQFETENVQEGLLNLSWNFKFQTCNLRNLPFRKEFWNFLKLKLALTPHPKVQIIMSLFQLEQTPKRIEKTQRTGKSRGQKKTRDRAAIEQIGKIEL